MSVVHLDSGNFKKEVLESSIPVMVDFYADWCGPCKMVAPVVEELAKDYEKKIKVGKLNIDDGQDIAGELGIMSIPTIMFFRNGKKTGQVVGAQSKSALDSQIKKHLA